MKFSQFASLAVLALLTLPMSVIAESAKANAGKAPVPVTIVDCMVKGPKNNNVQTSPSDYIHLDDCTTNTFSGKSIAVTVSTKTCLLKSGGKLVTDEYGNELSLKGCTPQNNS